MKPSLPYWISVVANPAMARTYHASFKAPGEPPRWVTARGGRKVFTDKQEAELEAARMLVILLNENPVIEVLSAPKPSDAIKAFRAEGVGKGSRPFKDHRSEADKVFSNFGKCD